MPELPSFPTLSYLDRLEHGRAEPEALQQGHQPLVGRLGAEQHGVGEAEPAHQEEDREVDEPRRRPLHLVDGEI